MRIRAPPVIYLKTDEKLNTGRFILRTLPLLYLKHLILNTGAAFFVSGQKGPITADIFLNRRRTILWHFLRVRLTL